MPEQVSVSLQTGPVGSIRAYVARLAPESGAGMALIAVVDGVKLYMYPNDHPPAHLHALSAEYHAVIDLDTLALTRGHLPPPKARAIVAWAAPRREQLLEAWSLIQSHRFIGRIG